MTELTSQPEQAVRLDPPYDYPGYRSTALRAPKRPLIAMAGQGFAEVLSAEVERYGERLSGFDLSSALDPRAYIGFAGDFVDAVVARIRGWATARGSSSGS